MIIEVHFHVDSSFIKASQEQNYVAFHRAIALVTVRNVATKIVNNMAMYPMFLFIHQCDDS
jgi:hypothetical protein